MHRLLNLATHSFQPRFGSSSRLISQKSLTRTLANVTSRPHCCQLSFPTISSSDSKTCASCTKDHASQVCAGCNGSPNPTSTGLVKTLYCDSACQKADWIAHKVACKAHQARKILYRAGETAQMAIYMFRGITYKQSIERVESKEDSLILYEGYYDDPRFFLPFPHELLQHERDKQAALVYLTSCQALAEMHEFFKIMLKGTCSSIAEVVVKIEPRKRPLKMIRPSPFGLDDEYGHGIMKVTLKNGEVYAIDITGAQHGYYDAVYLWDQYVQTRVQTAGEAMSFGSLKAVYLGPEWCGLPRYQGRINRLDKAFAEAFDHAVGEWQRKGVKVAEMLRMGEEAFVRTREELMGYVAGVLQDLKKRGPPGLTSKMREWILNDAD